MAVNEDPELERVTIYQVAERVGVSISTVSQALNRPERVAESTRRRVLDTAAEMGFSARRRTASPRKLHRIGVCAPFSRHPTFLQRLTGLLSAATGIDVITCDIAIDGLPQLDSLPIEGPVDGVVVMGLHPGPKLLTTLRKAGTSLVLVDQFSSEHTCVTVDDEVGGTLLAEHFWDLGARRVTWVSTTPPPIDLVTTGERRLRGFVNALRAHDPTAEVGWTICDETIAGGREAAAEIAGAPLPDAILAAHDVIAAGLVTGLEDHGIRVPDDVIVGGYDDTDLAEAFRLTTVRQPFAETGIAALDALRNQYEHPNRPAMHISLLPQLVVRSTTTPSEKPSTPAPPERTHEQAGNEQRAERNHAR